jgi:hypothetical protein
MATLPNISSQDGARITVNDWINSPKTIPTYVLSLMDQEFLPDAVLRNAGDNNSGVVRHNATTPLYSDTALTEREEFGEIPVGTGSIGTPVSVYTVETSQAVVISARDQKRNAIGKLQLRMQQTKNTIVKAWNDRTVKALLDNAGFNFTAASTWATPDYDIRSDWLSLMKLVRLARDPNGSLLGYKCDTAIINPITSFDLMRSKEFNAEYFGGNIADENLRYTGVLPQKILNCNVLESDSVPIGQAIFLQRGQSGYISDEEPLEATPLYFKNETRTWRSDLWRTSAIGIDQPLSVAVAHGL